MGSSPLHCRSPWQRRIVASKPLAKVKPGLQRTSSRAEKEGVGERRRAFEFSLRDRGQGQVRPAEKRSENVLRSCSTLLSTRPEKRKTFLWKRKSFIFNYGFSFEIHFPGRRGNSYLEPRSWGRTHCRTDTDVSRRSPCQICRTEDTSSSPLFPQVFLDTTLQRHPHMHTCPFRLFVPHSWGGKNYKLGEIFFPSSFLFSVWRKADSEWVAGQTFASRFSWWVRYLDGRLCHSMLFNYQSCVFIKK